MPNVLVVGGMIKCTHGGVIQLSQGESRLEIAGAAALTAGMEANLSFAGGPNVVTPCPFPAPPPAPPGTRSPCTSTLPATAGMSAVLSVDGLAVLLDSASGPAVNANDPGAGWGVLMAGQTLFSIDR